MTTPDPFDIVAGIAHEMYAESEKGAGDPRLHGFALRLICAVRHAKPLSSPPEQK